MEPMYVVINLYIGDPIFALKAWFEGTDLVFIPSANTEIIDRIALAAVANLTAC